MGCFLATGNEESATITYTYEPLRSKQESIPRPLGYGKKDGEVFSDSRGKKYVKWAGTIRKYNNPDRGSSLRDSSDSVVDDGGEL